jgi:ribosomal protein L11 methylase PrmA
LLESQADEAARAYGAVRFSVERRLGREEWAALVLARK